MPYIPCPLRTTLAIFIHYTPVFDHFVTSRMLVISIDGFFPPYELEVEYLLAAVVPERATRSLTVSIDLVLLSGTADAEQPLISDPGLPFLVWRAIV